MAWRRVGEVWVQIADLVPRAEGWIRGARGWEREAKSELVANGWRKVGEAWEKIAEEWQGKKKPIRIGDHVRIKLPGKRAESGRVTGEAGDCWVIGTERIRVNKCYCDRIRASRSKASSLDGDVYGDGEV